MPIPNRDFLRLEVLKYLNDGNEHTQMEILEYLAVKKFRLSNSERKQKMRDGKKSLFDNRVRWVFMDLKTATLIEKTKNQQAAFRITTSGSNLLKLNPSKIDTKILLSFSGYRKWKKNEINNIKKDLTKERKKIDYTNGVIVLLDSLGTKGKWKTEQKPNKISRSWHNLLDTFRNSINHEFEGEDQQIHFLTFSDTIMIIVQTDSDVKTTLLKLASALRIPFIMSMMLNNPIRGCIAIGSFHLDGSFIVGPAIEEAANYFELPQWIGISASPKANREIEKISDSNPDEIRDSFFRCDIPLSTSIEQNAWALRWPDISDMILKLESSKKYENMLDFMNEKLENTTSIAGALKWRNTLKFYDLVMQKNRN